MIRFQQEKGARGRSRTYVVVALLCIALLAILAVAQVAHFHQTGADADHCPICTVLHAVTPLAVAAAIIILVQLGKSAPLVPAIRTVQRWHPTLFNRPPPALVGAA